MTTLHPLDRLQAVCLASDRIVVTFTIYQDSETEKQVLLWDEVRLAFPEVLYLRYHNDPTSELPFLKGPDSEILKPRRIIAAESGVILEAIVKKPFVERDPKTRTTTRETPQWPEVEDRVIPGNSTEGQAEAAMEKWTHMKSSFTVSQWSDAPQFVSDNYTSKISSTQSVASKHSPQVQLDDFAQTLFNARNDDAAAQVKLGTLYQEGRGRAEKNLGEAVHWYRRAAEQGNADGQYRVGVMLSCGLGVPQNQELAMGWYKKAAEGGNSDAQNELGVIYKTGLGDGVTQDFTIALEWFVKSAEQGNPKGQTSLGLMYKNGYGTPQDYSKAMEWFMKAANEHGHAQAQVGVGVLYEGGSGVRQNYSTAMKWYVKAAEQGYDDAQFKIGDLYCYGHGVPQSFSMAGNWYSRAAEQGHVDAKENLREIKKFLQGNPQLQPQQPASMWNRAGKLFA